MASRTAPANARYPLGTVIEAAEGCYQVQGASGLHRVRRGRATWTCSCPAFRFRYGGTRERCRHIRCVESYVWIQQYRQGR